MLDSHLKRFIPYFYNALPLVIKNIVFVMLSFFQLYIMTNYLSTESYGKLQFVLTIIASIVFLTLPGSGLAYNKMGAKRDEKYYFALLKYKIKFSLIGSLVILGISLFYFDDKSLFYGLLISSVAFPFFYNLDAYSSLLNGQEKFHKKVKYEILKQFTVVSLLTTTVLFFSKDIIVLLFIIFGASILFNILAHLIIFRNSVKRYLKIRSLASYKKYTKDMSWISVVGAIEGRLDRLVVGIFFGFTNLAVFYVAKVIQDQFKSLWVIFANLIIPKTYKKNQTENVIFLLKILGYSIFIFSTITFLAIIIFPFIFSLFFNEQYSNSLNYLNIMLFNVVLGIPNAVLIIYFNTYSFLKSLLLIKISSFVVYFLCLVVFSYYWQIWGIIYANLFRISYSSVITVILFFMERRKVLNENIISI